MKTNGLRNKKPAMARAAWRSRTILYNAWRKETFDACTAIINWHRAAKGRK